MRLAPIVVEHVAGVRHERRVDERGRVVAERQTSPTLYPSEIQLGNTNLISKTPSRPFVGDTRRSQSDQRHPHRTIHAMRMDAVAGTLPAALSDYWT
jgi:hypothetical protein